MKKIIFVLSIGLSLSAPVSAGDTVFSTKLGGDFYEIKGSFLGDSEKGSSGLYLSSLSSSNETSFGGLSLTGSRYQNIQLGFEYQDKEHSAKNGGSVYFYKSKDNVLINRYGFGFGLNYGRDLNSKASLFIGGDFLPQWFSTSWDDGVYFEYGYRAGVSYSPLPSLSVELGYMGQGGVPDTDAIIRYLSGFYLGLSVSL